MRISVRPLFLLLLFSAGLFELAGPRVAQAEATVTISFFQERLAPYGRWVLAGSYGRCWAPERISAGWSPYLDGEWVWTDYGWTWVSFDPWGDLVYHYGTWVWIDPYGWVWVPGTIWAPAWVTWAYTDDYIGWAPVPASFVLSERGYSGRPIVVSRTRYVFVPTAQFVGVNVSTVRVPVQQSAAIFPHATKVTSYSVANGVVHTAGPPPARVERVLGRRIERVSIDRVKSKPTTIAPAGGARGRSLAVVAPARERARIHPTTGTETRAVSASPQRARPPRPERAVPPRSERKHLEGPAASAPRRERPAVAREERHVKPAPERHGATTRPERPASSERGKPREQRDARGAPNANPAPAAPAARQEDKHEAPPAAAPANPPGNPHSQPPGQVKKEQARPPNPGHAEEKKDKKDR